MDKKSGISLPQFIIDKGYSMGEEITRGKFGDSKIYSAKVTTKDFTKDICMKRYALKTEPNKNSKDRMDWEEVNKRVKEELKILKKIKHPYIIRVWDVMKTEHNVYIFMDYAPNGTLMDLLDREKKGVDSKRTTFWFNQILGALVYIHKEGIAHRDIKLKCILLVSDDHQFKYNALLSDFKFGRMKDKEEEDLIRKTACGTVAYSAPEVHHRYKSPVYDPRIADMYSYGVCLFQLLNCHLPFDETLCGLEHRKHFEKQMAGDYRFHSNISKSLSKDMKDLVNALLEPNPGKRLTAANAMHHKAFSFENIL